MQHTLSNLRGFILLPVTALPLLTCVNNAAALQPPKPDSVFTKAEPWQVRFSALTLTLPETPNSSKPRVPNTV